MQSSRSKTNISSNNSLAGNRDLFRTVSKTHQNLLDFLGKLCDSKENAYYVAILSALSNQKSTGRQVSKYIGRDTAYTKRLLNRLMDQGSIAMEAPKGKYNITTLGEAHLGRLQPMYLTGHDAAIKLLDDGNTEEGAILASLDKLNEWLETRIG